jgi:hypothetical protein
MSLSDRRKEKLITLKYDNEINAVPSYIRDLTNTTTQPMIIA